jgi:3D-(3,5/4)-trihydroxycyclohexane-1,2-dione acylhydrolase (decyclizing)
LKLKEDWLVDADAARASSNAELPSDAQVIGAVQRGRSKAVLVCASGGLPGELHKLWRADGPGSYHLDYGFSTMGYEIAGGLAWPLRGPTRTYW